MQMDLPNINLQVGLPSMHGREFTGGHTDMCHYSCQVVRPDKLARFDLLLDVQERSLSTHPAHHAKFTSLWKAKLSW
jgi:hypothetical protein